MSGGVKTLRRMLKVERRHRVIVIGDSGTGKSQLLPGTETMRVDRERPTRGEQFATTNRSVSRDPQQPHAPPTQSVALTCREVGGNASGERLLSQNPKLRGNDVVVVVFDARRPETYASVWSRWVPLVNGLVAGSGKQPFIVLTETHADKVPRARLARHRRAAEIDLYMAFQRRFIYRQLCTLDGQQRDAFWDQVCVQLRWQPRRGTIGSVSVVEQTFTEQEGYWERATSQVRLLLGLSPDPEAGPCESDFVLV